MNQDYKVKIDKELLTQFFITETPTEAQLKEIRKVITVVMIKHYSNYQNDKDLIQYALLAVLSRRQNYDPAYSAYSYIYTICRNEIGNNINKLNRVIPVESLNRIRGAIITPGESELPPEVEKFKEHLLGTTQFNYVRISRKDALNLIIFLRLHDSRNRIEIPDFLPDNKEVRVLYKLLQETFYE